ncbi:NUDIX domain-containing protein [Streptomyces sp. HC307]|uniref:NUDIX domain-containing protein n=1 Tax=Streptomyces flavusporus TaxID=3385496 RepID=UPI003916E043
MRRLIVRLLVATDGRQDGKRVPLVLLVKDLVTASWDLPGGEVPEGEALPDAAARLLEQQTGLALPLARALTFDQTWGGTFSGTGETLTVVLDAGHVGKERARTLAALPDQVGTMPPVKWAPLSESLPPHLQHAVVFAARGGLAVPVLVNGESDMERMEQKAQRPPA